MSNRKVIHSAEQFGPGWLHNGGGMHSRTWQVTCDIPSCRKVFQTTAPRQRYCSPECLRMSQVIRERARKVKVATKSTGEVNARILQRKRQEEGGVAPRADSSGADSTGGRG